MSWWRTLKGGRSWFGKREAKAAGRVSRRQADDEAIAEQLDDLCGACKTEVRVCRRLQREGFAACCGRCAVTGHRA